MCILNILPICHTIWVTEEGVVWTLGLLVPKATWKAGSWFPGTKPWSWWTSWSSDGKEGGMLLYWLEAFLNQQIFLSLAFSGFVKIPNSERYIMKHNRPRRHPAWGLLCEFTALMAALQQNTHYHGAYESSLANKRTTHLCTLREKRLTEERWGDWCLVMGLSLQVELKPRVINSTSGCQCWVDSTMFQSQAVAGGWCQSLNSV